MKIEGVWASIQRLNTRVGYRSRGYLPAAVFFARQLPSSSCAPLPQAPLVAVLRAERSMPAVSAFVLLACAPLERLTAGAGVAVAELGAEGIHELRVAACRLRAFLAVFEYCLDGEAVAFLHVELSWLQHRFAAARDWDVFIAKTLAPLSSSRPGERSLELLMVGAQKRRSCAHVMA